MDEPHRRIRAVHTASTVTVYQAYSPHIGQPAAREGRFPPVWKRDRMTWIKPSFLWMMYRCGLGAKAGQETVLAVEITRDGFEWALRRACLSSYVRGVHPDRAAWQRQVKQAPARVQWDPERDLRLRPMAYRSLQLGLPATWTPRPGCCPRSAPTPPLTNYWPTCVRDQALSKRPTAGHGAHGSAGSPVEAFPVGSGWHRCQRSGASSHVTLRSFRPRPK